ncbi:hypothetical protein QSF59_000403 [Escherichia coli]|nr:hypothetical protein [Escherichia coli]
MTISKITSQRFIFTSHLVVVVGNRLSLIELNKNAGREKAICITKFTSHLMGLGGS